MKNPSLAQRVIAPLLVFFAATAVAEEVVDEIVVMADFRGRPASEIPGSVSIIDAAFIEQASTQHFE